MHPEYSVGTKVEVLLDSGEWCEARLASGQTTRYVSIIFVCVLCCVYACMYTYVGICEVLLDSGEWCEARHASGQTTGYLFL